MSKPIFLFTPSAGMTPAILRKMERAGYIPLPVESFDSVRVVDPIALVSLDTVCRAAFDTIADASGHSTIPDTFGRRVAKALGTQPSKEIKVNP